MLYNPNEPREREQVERCLRRLSTDEFSPLIQSLKRRLSDYYETLSVTSDATLVYRVQGRIQELREILESVATATKHS